MTDSPQRNRLIDLSALLTATGPEGRVDLTAFEAQAVVLTARLRQDDPDFR
ncbi:hypothetical protein [Solilutibacter pythonis]|uniref:hypothetical protein n=1 Tax=Solilutibacter pythonis TaxID=2483112 RepID=UPI001314AD2C|nr:hypothetical protein [Lysobacter pythonis]